MSADTVSTFYHINGEAMNTAWYGAQDQIDVESVTVPFLQHELILNFGDEFSVNHSPNKSVIFTEIQTKAIATKAKGKYEALGFMFSPAGIYETFGLSLTDFKSLSADDPDKVIGLELMEKIRSQITSEEKLGVVIQHFRGCQKKKPLPPVVLQILHYAHRAIGRPVEINQLAAELNFSSKHLISAFKTVVGITPKKYLLLCQLNGAVQNMLETPGNNLTQVALLNGFFDQSHFIRMFRKFTGFTPFSFRAKRRRQAHAFPNTLIC